MIPGIYGIHALPGEFDRLVCNPQWVTDSNGWIRSHLRVVDSNKWVPSLHVFDLHGPRIMSASGSCSADS